MPYAPPTECSPVLTRRRVQQNKEDLIQGELSVAMNTSLPPSEYSGYAETNQRGRSISRSGRSSRASSAPLELERSPIIGSINTDATSVYLALEPLLGFEPEGHSPLISPVKQESIGSFHAAAFGSLPNIFDEHMS